MNLAWVTGEIEEAKVHIDALVKKLRSDPELAESDFAASIYFAHIQSHLNRAWHVRNMTNDEIGKLSQDEFEKISSSIPNFGNEFQMIGLNESPTGKAVKQREQELAESG